MSDRATSFGTQAGSYDRARPGYPAASVAWLVPDRAQRIADVGAGTGKLTDGLVASGRTVIAIDPDAAMLDVLAKRHPTVGVRQGTAEAVPLDDASVDAVVLGQAWHWVDPAAGSAELGRVLRPGGTLGLIWNIRDESVDWVEKLAAVVERSPGEQIVEGDGPQILRPFTGALDHREERWTRHLTVEGLLDLVRSRSSVIGTDDATRAHILEAVRAIGEREADADGTLALPYVTHAFRITRP